MSDINDFIGVPFADGEESFDGANCYGLVRLFYKEYLKIDIPSLSVKSDHSRVVFATYLKQISEHWQPINEPEEFCVVAMAYDIRHPKIVQHFGIYLGNGKVLHTLDKINSHITTLDNIRSAIRGFYKWRI